MDDHGGIPAPPPPLPLPPPYAPPAPPPLLPSTQGLEDLQFGEGQEIWQETGTTKNCSRASWNHKMKSYLIWLLKEHDVPTYRTRNAWSKEAWRRIVDAFNTRFGLSLSVTQVKQKEQDLKKDFKAIRDLISESGFGWDRDMMMVVAPDSVWEELRARKNKDALRWQDKSFPYYYDIFALYDGRYAQGRGCHGTDNYANKAAHVSMELPEDLHRNHQPSHSTPEPTSAKRGKRQKTNSNLDDFQERYLSFKREELDRFAAIEERKLEDPYSIQNCIAVLEGLPDLQTEDMLKAADLFTDNKDNREVFLSFSSKELRLAWLKRKIQNT
ncbi:L10-interacting MYB domain-containing protein-like [Triticum urartu]|uniref:Myb/SANT-like domain-containing protein n=1 Tax=Triticum urartu TaxID=4572 RepID=A0A8R7QM06_TRIUA|nr:L10-interacting MYB domain-containing protein-like [Triticum urartu]